MGRLVEGFWDCTSCGAKKIRGSIRVCPSCGKTRSEGTIFYLDQDARYVPEEEALHINRNPDWVCEHCKSMNSDDDQVCSSCGTPRTSKSLDYFESHEEIYQKELAKYNDELKAYEESLKGQYNNPVYRVLDFLSYNSRTILIGLLALLGIVGLIFLIWPRNREFVVQQISWQRNIDIERYQTVEEDDWYLPTGARLQFSQMEFSHYQQVLDHYETVSELVAKERIVGYTEEVVGYQDLGNGYFDEITTSVPVYETYYETEYYEEPVYRDEPVYRMRYYYEIDRWLYERTVTTSGNNKSPYWGETNLYSDERISNQTENYYIIGIDKKDKESTISLSYDDWNSLEIGQSVTLRVSLGFGEIVE